ncbi:MAG: hypothetical protein HETSPECPRED_007131 [Heterodermia speciosa]|uniref:Uncharacterized protein n=1 Tax=Heterodermia speciosa TaxID=116794 RepID=A0A8H3I4X4_9LECA|nr:MAG: hypothetical protein HETSPECPRED_007131 [Heterodermia speciosa]
MEGAAFFYIGLVQHQQRKRFLRANLVQSTTTYQHSSIVSKRENTTTNQAKLPRRPQIPASFYSKYHQLKSRLAGLNPYKMPSGLVILYVPSNPKETPQFVRLARKGIGMNVVFLHPNGQLYKIPHYADLKGYVRDCGPQTAPVMGGGKRTCEGGCCAWFTIDVDDDGKDILDKLELDDEQDTGDRPKHDIFLVRHGTEGETNARKFMEEGLDHIKKNGRGWLGKAALYR